MEMFTCGEVKGDNYQIMKDLYILELCRPIVKVATTLWHSHLQFCRIHQ